jgi:hypothetical protein
MFINLMDLIQFIVFVSVMIRIVFLFKKDDICGNDLDWRVFIGEIFGILLEIFMGFFEVFWSVELFIRPSIILFWSVKHLMILF